eukprot:863715-Rhodomonas_salina.2
MDALGNLRYAHSVLGLAYAATDLYAMCGTERAYAATDLYAMCGTERAYAATRRFPPVPPPPLRQVTCLSDMRTELAYGGSSRPLCRPLHRRAGMGLGVASYRLTC